MYKNRRNGDHVPRMLRHAVQQAVENPEWRVFVVVLTATNVAQAQALFGTEGLPEQAPENLSILTSSATTKHPCTQTEWDERMIYGYPWWILVVDPLVIEAKFGRLLHALHRFDQPDHFNMQRGKALLLDLLNKLPEPEAAIILPDEQQYLPFMEWESYPTEFDKIIVEAATAVVSDPASPGFMGELAKRFTPEHDVRLMASYVLNHPTN